MKSKKEIRTYIKERRAMIAEDKRKLFNNIIFEKVIGSEDYKKVDVIFIFVSYMDEVDTHRIIDRALKDGKTICVPKTISLKEGMIAVEIKKFEDLIEGVYGILEPKSDKLRVDERLIDLVYVPGLAFDIRGGRIGYGGGFYDRFLRKTRENCKKVALAYSLQVLDQVPMEEYDTFIDGIITD